MKEIENNIREMEFARKTHIQWAEHLEAGGCEKCDITLTGDAEYHRSWVQKYDTTIKLLEHYLEIRRSS